MKKDFLKTDEILTTSYAKPSSIKTYMKTLQLNNTPKQKNTFDIKGYHFEDNADIVFNSLDLFYARQKVSESIGLGVDGGIFSIEDKNTKKYSGFRYGISLYWNNFHFHIGENKYDDFSEFVPYISYTDNYKNHNYILEYTRQNALFYTYALCPYNKRIDTDHFSVSDYVTFENQTDLWMNVQANVFSNSDTNYIAQYDWRFFHNTLGKEKKLSYNLALEGWYTMHTKQNSCFYSPSFADTTMLRFDPIYHFSNYLNISGKFGAGYSFEDKNFIYKTGLWFFGNPTENISYNIGCLYSNASKINSNKTNYNYKECVADMGYAW